MSRSNVATNAVVEAAFAEVVNLIHTSRQRAMRAVNTELIDLYWRVGEYLHFKIEADGWAKGTVVQLAGYIAQREPGLRGFSPQNLWRMRQFFEAYRDDSKLSPLVRVLPWTHNLIILGQSKRPEEREFYLRMAIDQRWGKRELEQQFHQALFERTVLHPPKLSPAVSEIHGEVPSKPWTATTANPMKTRPSACCCARPKTAKWSNTRSAARCLPRWSPSIRPSCLIKTAGSQTARVLCAERVGSR